MNKIKLEYEAPEVNTLEVKFEGCFCVSDPNQERPNSASSGYDPDNDLDEI